ncbi:hypothetical protein ANO14919_026870 [Xylariales sp. No.14919]|nr:hypothetical protein ANO14919_026870 [Xylariales sp. No.14919]
MDSNPNLGRKLSRYSVPSDGGNWTCRSRDDVRLITPEDRRLRCLAGNGCSSLSYAALWRRLAFLSLLCPDGPYCYRTVQFENTGIVPGQWPG